MAFENLYGGIDFQSQNKMAMAQQQQFADMLGKGIAAAQQNRALDIQERQMEQKANEFNIEKAAQNAYMKHELGQPLTPEDVAAYEAYSAFIKPTMGVDKYGNPTFQRVPLPPLGGARGGQPRGQGIVPEVGASRIDPVGMGDLIGGGQMAQRGEFPAYDMISDDYVEPMGDVPLPQMGGANIPANAPQDVVSSDDPVSFDYQAPAQMGGAGELLTEKARSDVAVAQAKADIQFRKEQMKSEKGKQKVTKTINKTMDSLEELNDKLKAKQAIINNDSGIINNLKSKYGSTWLGRQTSSVTAPEIESLRQKYETTRDSLIPAYIAYFELPATVVDTEEFQQRILNSFGDPKMNYEANQSALSNMRMQFGLEKGGQGSKESQRPTPEQIRAELQRRRGQ